jgi:hypothetical protein
MKIDAQKIINETVAVFEKSGAAEIFRNCTSVVKDEDYKRLHPFPLTPTNIVIDCNAFNMQVKQYNNKFQKWGTDHQHLQRYGLAVVNQSGDLIDNDPINGSLMAWNRDNPTHPLIETGCVTPTEVLNLPSLEPLSILNGHWCRSNILKWHSGAFFFPHIDTVVPSMWIRLWAATSNDVVLRFYNPANGELEQVDYEPGRVYVIDTSLVHDASTTGFNVLQLFLSVLPSAYDLLINNTNN